MDYQTANDNVLVVVESSIAYQFEGSSEYVF